ncbi:MAG: ATP-binding cassette domain-containing protein, partial [Candidatus Erginobacter occultus]|nr:ATP-binding cassette domain-containing protein [Candidatus Erginobacter occultus]
MNSTPHIRVRNLNVRYGTEPALKNINLVIPARKITAIIGPSGCGKSTLLKTFNRMLELVEGVSVSGTVEVDGENIYRPGVEVTAVRKKMGLLSQTPFVLPMSIFDNVAYGPRIHGLRDKIRLAALVENRLREAQLWEEVKGKLHTPASRLSVGQQQRLCLARGLA